jgi:hypothetical protein
MCLVSAQLEVVGLKTGLQIGIMQFTINFFIGIREMLGEAA